MGAHGARSFLLVKNQTKKKKSKKANRRVPTLDSNRRNHRNIFCNCIQEKIIKDEINTLTATATPLGVLGYLPHPKRSVQFSSVQFKPCEATQLTIY